MRRATKSWKVRVPHIVDHNRMFSRDYVPCSMDHGCWSKQDGLNSTRYGIRFVMRGNTNLAPKSTVGNCPTYDCKSPRTPTNTHPPSRSHRARRTSYIGWETHECQRRRLFRVVWSAHKISQNDFLLLISLLSPVDVPNFPPTQPAQNNTTTSHQICYSHHNNNNNNKLNRKKETKTIQTHNEISFHFLPTHALDCRRNIGSESSDTPTAQQTTSGQTTPRFPATFQHGWQ